jgi:TM2 domain-containing membrane protein YozV
MKNLYTFLFINLFIFCLPTHASAILLLKADTSIVQLQNESIISKQSAKTDEGFLGKKNQTLAFILALLFGWVGFHDFYAEKNNLAAIKFAMGTLGLFLIFFIPPLGILLLIATIVWAMYDAYRIYNGDYLPEEGDWDIKMK